MGLGLQHPNFGEILDSIGGESAPSTLTWNFRHGNLGNVSGFSGDLTSAQQKSSGAHVALARDAGDTVLSRYLAQAGTHQIGTQWVTVTEVRPLESMSGAVILSHQ